MIRNVLFILCLVAVVIGCSSSSNGLSKSAPVENALWKKEDALNMSFEVNDTIRLFDFILNIRHDERYKYSNLYLFVDLHFPNGKVSSDTLELTLADVAGEWVGNGGGSLYEVGFKYKDRKKFPFSGLYNISIRHGMRESEILGITDVGLSINNSLSQ